MAYQRLTTLDVQLLEYIQENQCVEVLSLSSVFPYGFLTRIEKLQELGYIRTICYPLHDIGVIELNDMLAVTDKGGALLNDFSQNNKEISDKDKKARKEYIKNNVLTPIIVTVVTTLIIHLLQVLLLAVQ